jgi:tetratricopeptide (TPR) repeat protein
MPTRLQRLYGLIGFAFGSVLTAAVGCNQSGQPIREDRSINWSSEGGSVDFQHGQQGIFIADNDGRKLKKIFQPTDGTLASSTPLWSPSGKRVIFTTARGLSFSFSGFSLFGDNDQDPRGRLHFQEPIDFTCWLCEQNDSGETKPPIALFNSKANHTGYVAANLAIRWHPHLDRIDYIKEVSPDQHAIFEYDLNSKESRQIFPVTSEALIFDWTPDGSKLVCVLGNSNKEESDGIWIGHPDQGDWWQVPDSGNLTMGEFGSLLESLRATRPAWTADGTRFAFPARVAMSTPQNPNHHFLRVGTLATRKVENWAEGETPYRDLQWDKIGRKLGFVCGTVNGSLHVMQRSGLLSPAINSTPVRRFFGWNADGDRLAYTSPSGSPHSAESPWALLLLPNNSARDQVFVVEGDAGPGKLAFSDMRVTFPQWAPKDDKLSLWVTFAPACQSMVSNFLGWSGRYGDPAAVFDLKTQQLSLMPVSAPEMAQAGHCCLLRRDYAQAWRWYEEAEKKQPKREQAIVRNWDDFYRSVQGPRDFGLFEYLCLNKLDRQKEAQAKLARFRREFFPRIATSQDEKPEEESKIERESFTKFVAEMLGPEKFCGQLLLDLYAAEVFLSVNAHEDAEAYFRAEIILAASDEARLSRAIVLGQVLLLEEKYREYAELATGTIAPLLNNVLPSYLGADRSEIVDLFKVVAYIGEYAVVPMGAKQFLGTLPNGQVREMLTRWEKMRASANERTRPLFDLVLRGMYQKLGMTKELGASAKRLESAPRGDFEIPNDDDLGAFITKTHQDMQANLRNW